MLKAERLFKFLPAILCTMIFAGPVSVSGSEGAVEYKKNEVSLFRDIFDQNVYYEATSYLRLDRIYQGLFRKKSSSEDVNAFDEVPDSNFFTNRHARKKLSDAELEAGHHDTDGPDTTGKLTINHGTFDATHPSFLIKDGRGDEYTLRFDPADSLELETSAEVIASRFFYAIGYNVPQYNVITFEAEKLTPDPAAKIADDTGFSRNLTSEKLQEYLLFLPWASDGKFRASASKLPAGEDLGNFNFKGRRKNDPQDKIDHAKRREIRALRVFSSWLNNNDTIENNTLDLLVDEGGSKVIKHYLTEFNSALGSDSYGAKPAMFGHEYLMDYGETFKAFWGLGLWEKPWQKRWREAGEKNNSSALGYFDNREFNPGKFKSLLPQYAFKDLTRADGFWAAKIIMSFTDTDIRSMVKAGKLSNQQDEEYLTKTLIERRDIIGRYWFEEANPLDGFDVRDGALVFNDLAVQHSFASAQDTVYYVDVIAKKGNHGKKLDSQELHETSLKIDPSWFSASEDLDVFIRTARGATKPSKKSSYVLVELSSKGVSSVLHQD